MEEERRDIQSKKDLEERVGRLDSQLTRLQADLRKVQEESRQTVAALQKGRADVDVRFDETMLQLRMIEGKMEQGQHRYSELSHQIENVAFRINELRDLKGRLTEQEKKLEVVQKAVQSQIDAVKGTGGTLQKSVEEHEKRLKELSGHLAELSGQVSEWIDKVLGVLNTHASQLTDLQKRIQLLGSGDDVRHLNQGLVDLSKALDLLGETVTAKVDEQDQLLKKTSKRLETLESKLASLGKNKKSAFSPGDRSEGLLLTEFYYEVGAAYYELDDLARAREAFEKARLLLEELERSSEPSAWQGSAAPTAVR